MKISQCRSCKSKNIKKAFDLGLQSLTGVFPKTRESSISKGRLSLALCINCSLLQLVNSFDRNEMYGDNYGYMSSLNQSMINHLENKVKRFWNDREDYKRAALVWKSNYDYVKKMIIEEFGKKSYEYEIAFGLGPKSSS